MTYLIRVTEASGDVVSINAIEAADRPTAERRHAEDWNDRYGHTVNRYMSELVEEGEVVNTIGGWDEEED